MCLGIPGQIVEILDSDNLLAVVNVGGVKRAINIAFVCSEDHPPAACLGEWVLVHVGFAMSRFDEQEAFRTLDLLRELGEMQAEMETIRASPAPDDEDMTNRRRRDVVLRQT